MPAPFDPKLVWGLAAALVIGALVGTEREKSKALSGNVGIGGVRTFILFALSGAVGGWLAQALQSAWVFVATVGAVAALTVAGYLTQARVKPEAVGLTTETAAVTVCLLGGACTAGYPQVALALGVAVSGVLAYKEPMHGLVARLGADDIAAGVKLLAASLIVLPLLPNEPVDPWGAIRPQSLWLLVVLIAAAVARRLRRDARARPRARHRDHRPHRRPRLLDRGDARLREAQPRGGRRGRRPALAAGRPAGLDGDERARGRPGRRSSTARCSRRCSCRSGR